MSGELSLDSVSTTQSSKETTINGVFAELEAAIAGVLAVDCSAGNGTVSATQAKRNSVVRITGNTVARTVTFSPTKRLLLVVNKGTAAVTLTVGSTTSSLAAGATTALYMDGTTNSLEVSGLGGATALSALTDIDFSTPATDGQVLTYSSSSGKWYPSTATGGGGGTTYVDFGTHLSWRLDFITNNGNGQTIIAKIEMAATPGGADQCATGGGTPTSKSNINGSAGPDKLYDGSAATNWGNGDSTMPNWAGYTFLTAKHVQEIRIQASASSGELACAPATFKLQYSDNTTNGTDGTWSDAYSFSTSTWTVGQVKTFTAPTV